MIELGQAKHVGPVDDQRIGGWNIEARFHNGCGQQHIKLPVIETRHDVFQLGWRHAAMGGAEFYFGYIFAQEFTDFCEVGYAWHDVETLAAAEVFAQQGFTDDHRIKRRDIGAHCQTVQGRCGDQRQLAHARQRQLQGSRNWRGSQCQHMDIGAHFLQAFLVLDAKVLLFINDEQAEIAELDISGEQRMGSHHDIDIAIFKALFDGLDLLAANQPGGLRYAQGQALETLGEGGKMLAGQKGCWHHNGHLLAIEGRHKGRTQGNLGFAEAHVTTNEAVHGAALLQVSQYGFDGRELILGFLVRESGAELIIGTVRWWQNVSRFQFTCRCRLDQVFGNLADTLLESGFLGLPGATAQTVKLAAIILRAIAREQFDVFNGQKKPVIAGINQQQAIMGSSLHFNGLQALKTANAVVDMHHKIARCEC